MRKPAQFLEKSLEENGMSIDSVTHENNVMRQCETFTVTKRFGGEPHHYALNITEEEVVQEEESKLLAMYAQRLAQRIEDEMVETITFGERRIKVCPHEGGWAKCSLCDAEADLTDCLIPQMQFSKDAELGVPQPLPRDPERLTETISGNSQAALKLYLLGKLRLECDEDCPNFRYYDDLGRNRKI